MVYPQLKRLDLLFQYQWKKNHTSVLKSKAIYSILSPLDNMRWAFSIDIGPGLSWMCLCNSMSVVRIDMRRPYVRFTSALAVDLNTMWNSVYYYLQMLTDITLFNDNFFCHHDSFSFFAFPIIIVSPVLRINHT